MHAPALQLLLLLLLPSVAPDHHSEEAMPLTPQTRVVLASLEQGRAKLVEEDAFVRNLSRFDLECRLQTTNGATRDAWKAMVAQQVRPWEAEQREQLQRIAGSLAHKLADFNLPLPEQILLIRTTGKEEGNAAYCRGAAIVLPDRMLAQGEKQLERLLAHELFHVLSNQNPKLRDELYALIGFQRMPPLELPPSLRDRKITNPDAPAIDAWIELEQEGRKVLAAPVLYASVKSYNPASTKSFFDYLTFRLLVLERAGETLAPATREGEPVLLDPRSQASYMAQIGRNTKYIIHPDEILADNFALLVLGGQPVATPRILEDMRRLLGK